ncbi:MAG: PIN domain-containing protein [Candidatus Aminicenantes bacterium]|nr:PIN domain-containing protein [Candidatus Aminicenantes bacterium]
MSGRYFLDTNILVYSFDSKSPKKRERASALIAEALTGSRGIISFQVLQEFIHLALRKFAKPLTLADVQEYLADVLDPLCGVYPGLELYQRALDITGRWKYPFFDSLIIVAALQAGCSTLYSEDLQHGQTIDRLRIVNPFLE